MIYELRTYTAMPGKMPALQARFRDHTVKLFEKHGMKNIGYWTNSIGGKNDELVYILAYNDLAHRQQCWSAFGGDPDWVAARNASEAEGPLVHHVENRIMNPTNFSPLA
ncbi:MAG: NIPSNAP family protein [Dehalococcoidia bacterium]